MKFPQCQFEQTKNKFSNNSIYLNGWNVVGYFDGMFESMQTRGQTMRQHDRANANKQDRTHVIMSQTKNERSNNHEVMFIITININRWLLLFFCRCCLFVSQWLSFTPHIRCVLLCVCFFFSSYAYSSMNLYYGSKYWAHHAMTFNTEITHANAVVFRSPSHS